MPGECQPEKVYAIGDEVAVVCVSRRTRMLSPPMERYNAACNAVSPVAFSERQFSNIACRRLYSHVRETFGLSARWPSLPSQGCRELPSTKEAIKEQNKFSLLLANP